MLLFVIGCAVDPLTDMFDLFEDTPNDGNPESTKAWLWAFDLSVDSVFVYHTTDKLMWESFAMPADTSTPFFSGHLVGGGIYPTVWTGYESTAYAFMNGILDHDDHGHIVRPGEHHSIDLLPHLHIEAISVTPNGRTIVVSARDTISTDNAGHIYSIDYSTGDKTLLAQGTFRKVIVAGVDVVIAVSPDSRQAEIISIEQGGITGTVTIDTLASGAVYNPGPQKAYIATESGIQVLDLQTQTIVATIPYGSQGRVTGLVSVRNAHRALVFFGEDSGQSSTIAVLDMDNDLLHEVTIHGASLPLVSQRAHYDLSDDGRVAIIADMLEPRMYRFTLAQREPQVLDAPGPSCGVATNWGGTRIWALFENSAYQISSELNQVVDSMAFSRDIDRLMISSFRNERELWDSPDHTF